MKPIVHFIWANIAYLASGKLRSKNGYTPRSHHKIPEDFACVGVASANNAATDKAIIATLKYLNIQRVRLDFTYGDLNNHVGHFLQTLIKANFKVHLHLVQPLNEAKRMVSSSTQETWRQFIIAVCEQFGQQVMLIEVGSTINRQRWAGYTLESFLEMWGIAHQEIKARKIVLAGPSITDFEPLYNIGIFSLLKKRQQLPDIHTDNLFSERCTEPERDDHKILGHKLAPLGGFRLVKKAFVLHEIGQHFGVSRFHSPSAFWTLPRIERLLPDSEQKQADYLARYMLLCAASGTLESAAWGPLICHREGLIDDAVAHYPALERITHYQTIGDDLSKYRARPAFSAYQTFIKVISGLEYQGQLDERDYLEVHAFGNAVLQLHAIWTTNGKVAALDDVYEEEDLKTASFMHRDGMIIRPSMVGESPIYIQFQSTQPIKIKPQASTIKHCGIHLHTPNTEFHRYKKNNWQGVVAVKDQAEYCLLAQALNPDLMEGPSKPTTLRNARNAIWTIPDPRDPNKKLVVKQPVKFNLFKKITDRFKPSKALRSWTGAQELLRRGINNAKPIAYFENITDKTLKQNFYICEYIAADFSARDMFSAFAKGESHFDGVSELIAYNQISNFLLNMHNHGVFFRDLSGGNILVKKISHAELAFSLIDTGRARFFNHGTPMNMRLSDMARACNKLHTSGRNELMTIYMQKLNKPFGFWQKLPFIIYNIKVNIKRQLKVKNIKKWLVAKKTKAF